jgi:hypothetical protein
MQGYVKVDVNVCLRKEGDQKDHRDGTVAEEDTSAGRLGAHTASPSTLFPLLGLRLLRHIQDKRRVMSFGKIFFRIISPY